MKWMVLFWSLFFFSIGSHAKNLVVGVENIEYYPIYTVDGGEYGGYARELIDSFAEKYGHTVTYKPLPIKRLFGTFLDGGLDLKFPDNKHWASDAKKGKNVIYSTPALEYIDGAMVLPSRLGQGEEKLKKLGVIRGFTPWDYLASIKAGKIDAKENKQMSHLMRMAESGRVDAVYFNVLVARYFLKHSDFEDDLVKYDPALPHTQDFYYLSSIKHPDVITQFNEFMLKETELVNNLRKKYELEL
jgi:ABC-type amino acid transport substrate-binding protein